MQNPTTPTPLPLDRAATSSTAPLMSLPARSNSSAIISFAASPGSAAFAPWDRSGASATKPSAAKRRHTPLLGQTRPHHSWITTTPGPLPPAGEARYPTSVEPPLGNSITDPMSAKLLPAAQPVQESARERED